MSSVVDMLSDMFIPTTIDGRKPKSETDAKPFFAGAADVANNSAERLLLDGCKSHFVFYYDFDGLVWCVVMSVCVRH